MKDSEVHVSELKTIIEMNGYKGDERSAWKEVGCPDRRWILEENSIGLLREERNCSQVNLCQKYPEPPKNCNI